jgi:HTH-type transcriptional regulator/antitoxin HigA
MKTLTQKPRGDAADDYLELIRSFPLRTLRSDEDHSAAVKVLGRLMGRPGGRLSKGERDYADVLGRLIDDYGQKEYPHLPYTHSPLEILRFLMAEHAMNTDALGKILGNKTAASLVLNGKRELSKSHIRRLAEYFKMDAGLFF